jgi:hypothetical protein
MNTALTTRSGIILVTVGFLLQDRLQLTAQETGRPAWSCWPVRA